MNDQRSLQSELRFQGREAATGVTLWPFLSKITMKKITMKQELLTMR